jgi:hypothetical protein
LEVEALLAQKLGQPLVGSTTQLFRFAHWFFKDSNVKRCRGDAPSFPSWEGEGNLGLADSCITGNPHGAVKLIPSATPCQWHFQLNRLPLGSLVGELDFGNWVDIAGDTLWADCGNALLFRERFAEECCNHSLTIAE